MKKKILSAMAVAAVALVAGYNVYATQKSNVNMSELTLANVEALASGEYDNNNCRMNRITWICTPWGDGVGCYCYM